MNVHCPSSMRYKLDLTVKYGYSLRDAYKSSDGHVPRGPDCPCVLVKILGIIQQIQLWS